MLRCQFLCCVLKALFSIKIALELSYFCKKIQNFRALGAPPPDPQISPPLRVSGYAPARKCGPNCRAKHSSGIHDCHEFQTVGAAGETKAAPGSSVTSSVANTPTNNVKNVLKVRVAEKGTVLLRTSAVRVINQETGRSTLAYAQHDTASQATLISDSLREELGWK